MVGYSLSLFVRRTESVLCNNAKVSLKTRDARKLLGLEYCLNLKW